MALRGYVVSTELHLPEDFTLPVELKLPEYNLKEFRFGDYCMTILFPLMLTNKRELQFIDQLAVAETSEFARANSRLGFAPKN